MHQAGLESGIHRQSSALSEYQHDLRSGMLDFLACHGAEELIDRRRRHCHGKRMVMGDQAAYPRKRLPPAFTMRSISRRRFSPVRSALKLFREEQHLPAASSTATRRVPGKPPARWTPSGAQTPMANRLLASCRRPELDPRSREGASHAFMLNLQSKAGHRRVTTVEEFQPA